MKKNGCFKINFVNRPRQYPAHNGYMYNFPEGANRPGVATPVMKTIDTVMSVLCRYDRRMQDPGCDGCSKPWDIDYIRRAFGNEYLGSQLETVRHG